MRRPTMPHDQSGRPMPVKPVIQRSVSARVAVAQIWQPGPGDSRSAVDLMQPALDELKTLQPDLVVFPEYHLGWVRLGDGAFAQAQELARRYDTNLAVGALEMLPGYDPARPCFDQPGKYANSTFLFDRRGHLVCNYHKVHPAVGASSPYNWPPDAQDLEYTMRCGAVFPVVDLDVARVGLMTCYDGYFLPVFDILSLKGAEIIIWCNGRGDIEDYIVRTASHLTCTAIVASNHSHGVGAAICDFPGRMLARSTEARDQVLCAEIDLKQLRRHRRHLRMFHQRRPELYRDVSRPWRPQLNYPQIPMDE